MLLANAAHTADLERQGKAIDEQRTRITGLEAQLRDCERGRESDQLNHTIQMASLARRVAELEGARRD